MSFTRIHTVTTDVGDESFWLGVYADESASLRISGGGRKFDGGGIMGAHEDGSHIELCDEAREWLRTELATGRAIARNGS